MPTYDYKCSACDHVFERFQSITASPVRKCPRCGKSRVKRMLGVGAGLIFKGSGFYITDYRSEGYKNAAKADSPDTAKTPAAGASGEAPSATTPATGPAAPKPPPKSSAKKPKTT